MGGGGGSGGDGRKGVQFVAAHVRGIQFIVEQADGLHAEVPRGKRQNRRRVGEQQKKVVNRSITRLGDHQQKEKQGKGKLMRQGGDNHLFHHHDHDHA